MHTTPGEPTAADVTSRTGARRAERLRVATSGAARGRSVTRWAALAIAPAALALALAACTAESPAETGSPVAPSPSSEAPDAATAPPAALLPEGSAADNQPFFDSVNRALIAANPEAGGQEFTSALRDNGFDIAAMQVTPDITTVGVAADSIQFSVLFKEQCLIGQYGQGAYTSIVAAPIGTGACLIGQTRPIDW